MCYFKIGEVGLLCVISYMRLPLHSQKYCTNGRICMTGDVITSLFTSVPRVLASCLRNTNMVVVQTSEVEPTLVPFT